MRKTIKICGLVVLFISAVFFAAGCQSATSPYEEEKPEPKPKTNITVEVVDDATGEYLPSAKLYEDSTDVDPANFNDGIFRDTRPSEDREIGFYAEASGYQDMVSERIGNLKSDINITIRLMRKEEGVTGPGNVDANVGKCRDDGTAPITVTVEKNAQYVALLAHGEVIHEAKVDIEGGGSYTFKTVNNGSYRPLAKVHGADPVRGDKFTVDCEVPDEKISGFVRVDTEDGERINNADITFDGEGFNDEAVASNGIYDEMLDRSSGSITISVSADGFKSVEPRTVSREDDFREIFTLEKKEQPGPPQPSARVRCSDLNVSNVVVDIGGTVDSTQLIRESDGEIIDRGDGDVDQVEYNNLPDKWFKHRNWLNGKHKDDRFKPDCGANLALRFNRLNFDKGDPVINADDGDETYQISAFGNWRPFPDALTTGKVVGDKIEVILWGRATDSDGEVRMKLEFSTDKDANDTFRTPEFVFRSEDGFTSDTVMVDKHKLVEKRFGVEALHETTYRGDDSGEIEFLDPNPEVAKGSLKLRWKVKK